MKEKFLIVYVGVEGDKLSNYRGRPMAVRELGVEEGEGLVDPHPLRDDVERAIFDLTNGTAEAPDSKARLFAVIRLRGAQVFTTKMSARVEIQNTVGGAL